MENGTDALKMAFAMLVLVSALSIVMYAFTNVRKTATAVLDKSDKDTYYQIYNDDGTGKQYSFYREVGVDTVIANLYSYYGNFYTILFYNGEDEWNKDEHQFSKGDGKIDPIPLYYTEALDKTSDTDTNPNKNWLTQLGRSTLRINNTGRAIYGLDINDELTRQEPWSHNERNDKLFIDALINGKDWIWPNWSRTWSENIGINDVLYKTERGINVRYLKMRFQYMSEMGGKSLSENTKARFIERVGQYNYDAQFENNDQNYEGQGAFGYYNEAGRYNESNQTDSTIEFEDETGNKVGEIANTKITQKRVIQYIYIGESTDP